MKVISTLGLLLFSSVAFPKIWIVDSNPGSTAKDFTNLQAAHDGATAGDTLYLIGSSVNYITTKVTVTKRLVIIGPGYFLSENAPTQANVASAFLNNTTTGICEELELGLGSEGSVVMGLEIIGRVTINANNILFKRNHIRQETGCNETMLSINASNIMVVQNFMDGNLNNTSYPVIGVSASQTGIVVSNNYLYHACSGCGAGVVALYSPASSSVDVSNNIFRGGINVANGIVQNNLFLSNTLSFVSCLVRNNTANAGMHDLPAGNGNENNKGFNFVGSGSTDGKWQLEESSPLKSNGFGGTERGLFGGTEPYILSGIPPIPTIYSFTAPVIGEKNTGLPIQLKVKSNN